MFVIEPIHGTHLIGNLSTPDGVKLENTMDIEKARKTEEYLIVSGQDEATIRVENIKQYRKIPSHDLNDLDLPL